MARGIQNSSNPSSTWSSKRLTAETINVSSPAAPVSVAIANCFEENVSCLDVTKIPF
jgi:hypothetical protein